MKVKNLFITSFLFNNYYNYNNRFIPEANVVLFVVVVDITCVVVVKFSFLILF